MIWDRLDASSSNKLTWAFIQREALATGKRFDEIYIGNVTSSPIMAMSSNTSPEGKRNRKIYKQDSSIRKPSEQWQNQLKLQV